MKYSKFTAYYILPSFNLNKFSSLVKLNDIDSLFKCESPILSIVFYDLKKKNKPLFWYDKNIINFFYHTPEFPEILMLMKNSFIIK